MAQMVVQLDTATKQVLGSHMTIKDPPSFSRRLPVQSYERGGDELGGAPCTSAIEDEKGQKI